jgi:hypothetical protein
LPALCEAMSSVPNTTKISKIKPYFEKGPMVFTSLPEESLCNTQKWVGGETPVQQQLGNRLREIKTLAQGHPVGIQAQLSQVPEPNSMSSLSLQRFRLWLQWFLEVGPKGTTLVKRRKLVLPKPGDGSCLQTKELSLPFLRQHPRCQGLPAACQAS